QLRRPRRLALLPPHLHHPVALRSRHRHRAPPSTARWRPRRGHPPTQRRLRPQPRTTTQLHGQLAVVAGRLPRLQRGPLGQGPFLARVISHVSGKAPAQQLLQRARPRRPLGASSAPASPARLSPCRRLHGRSGQTTSATDLRLTSDLYPRESSLWRRSHARGHLRLPFDAHFSTRRGHRDVDDVTTRAANPSQRRLGAQIHGPVTSMKYLGLTTRRRSLAWDSPMWIFMSVPTFRNGFLPIQVCWARAWISSPAN